MSDNINAQYVPAAVEIPQQQAQQPDPAHMLGPVYTRVPPLQKRIRLRWRDCSRAVKTLQIVGFGLQALMISGYVLLFLAIRSHPSLGWFTFLILSEVVALAAFVASAIWLFVLATSQHQAKRQTEWNAQELATWQDWKRQWDDWNTHFTPTT